MDKYGEFYGQERISELLGMDKAALDFSGAHKKRKPRRDSSLSAVWGIQIRISQCFHTQFHVKFKIVTISVLLSYFLIIDLYRSQHCSCHTDNRLCIYSYSRIVFAHYSFISRLNSVDVKYQIWKLGVVFTDNVCKTQKTNVCKDFHAFILTIYGHEGKSHECITTIIDNVLANMFKV